MARPLSFPAAVTLPAAPGGMVPAGRVYGAIGIRRQWAWALRERHGFPASENGLLDVQSVAAFLIRRGVSVTFV